MKAYLDFLTNKLALSPTAGFPVAPDTINAMLFPFQRDIVAWAAERGRAAVFAECGLGKTFMQTEYGRLVTDHTQQQALIICPLAVAYQTIQEAARLGIAITYVRTQAEADHAPTALAITNYDRVIAGAFTLARFGAVILDESSKLKTFVSRTKKYLIAHCATVPYRLACSATPSPNDTDELGNHAEWLGVMTSGEMLTRWFIRDTQKAKSLRLKGHAVKDFWRWVTTWAVALGKPSDLGAYNDSGYVLPPLDYVHEVVETEVARFWEQGQLMSGGVQSATGVWKEKRKTVVDRAERVAEIVARLPITEPIVIWHDTDYERDMLKEVLPGVVIVTGSQSAEEKEERLDAFTKGQIRLLATKPRIGGYGLNWQHCANPIYMGVTHKWEDLYQSVKRFHRFGQNRAVRAHLIYAETETSVIDTLQRKQHQHETMQREMIAAMREHGLGLTATHDTLALSLGTKQIHFPSWLESVV